MLGDGGGLGVGLRRGVVGDVVTELVAERDRVDVIVVGAGVGLVAVGGIKVKGLGDPGQTVPDPIATHGDGGGAGAGARVGIGLGVAVLPHVDAVHEHAAAAVIFLLRRRDGRGARDLLDRATVGRPRRVNHVVRREPVSRRVARQAGHVDVNVTRRVDDALHIRVNHRGLAAATIREAGARPGAHGVAVGLVRRRLINPRVAAGRDPRCDVRIRLSSQNGGTTKKQKNKNQTRKRGNGHGWRMRH